MSHPIDDLFKRGLSNKSYDGLEEDWQNARVLLNLDSRKRRMPLWIWWIGGFVLLGIIGYGSLIGWDSSAPIQSEYGIQENKIVENSIPAIIESNEKNNDGSGNPAPEKVVASSIPITDISTDLSQQENLSSEHETRNVLKADYSALNNQSKPENKRLKEQTVLNAPLNDEQKIRTI